MVFEPPDGPPVIAQGGTLRLAVGAPDGPRSQTWNVTTHANSSDVYIGPRSSMGRVKLTLHEKTWRLAVTKEAALAAGIDPAVQDRVLTRWSPTAPFYEGGDWRPAVIITVPLAALCDPQPEKRVKGEPIRFFPPADPGFERLFVVMLGGPHAMPFTLNPECEGGRVAVADGGQIAVWVDQAPINPATAAEVEGLRAEWARNPPAPLPSPGFAHTASTQGVPVLIDVGMIYPQ